MTFAELQEKWSQVRAAVQSEVEKFSCLLASDDEGQVRSSFALLLSFGDCALCEILDEVDGQLRLQEEVVEYHHLLWTRCILEEVMVEDSIWYGLYVEHCFRRLFHSMYNETPWNELSDVLKEGILKEALLCVEVPAGTFMMGAFPDDEEARGNEKPRHEVILSKNMYVCVYTCTQALYEYVTGKNPSHFVRRW